MRLSSICGLVLATGGLAACTGQATLGRWPATLVTAANAEKAQGATLVINLAGLFGGPRRLQSVQGVVKAQVSITGPGITTPYSQQVDLTVSPTVTLTNVPVGTHRLITLAGLDFQGIQVAGAVMHAAGTLGAGLTTLTLSPDQTVVGEVFKALDVLDKAQGTQVLGKVDLPALSTAVAGYARSLRAPHFALLDAPVIAAAVHANNGLAPAAAANFLRKPGALLLRPQDWPVGAKAVVTVNDPVSAPFELGDATPREFGPVAPGTWTLTLTPSQPGLTVQTRAVTVAAGATAQVPLSFAGGSVGGPAMPSPLGGAIWGTVTRGELPLLIALGGVTHEDGNQLEQLGVLEHTPNGIWTTPATITDGVFQAAFTVHQGLLYWFGGLKADGPVSTGFRYDPTTQVTPGSLGALPGNRRLWGAAAGSVGNKVYMAGGVDLVTFSTTTFAFVPTTGQWSTETLPALDRARVDMASVSHKNVWYVFGGRAPSEGTAYTGYVDLAPVDNASAFSVGTAATWRTLPAMPTARSGAAAIAVDDKLWVIGGCGRYAQPTTAVEVYDPANNTWTLRPPLERARAFATLAFMNGKIRVMGGAVGPDPLTSLILADTEELTP